MKLLINTEISSKGKANKSVKKKKKKNGAADAKVNNIYEVEKSRKYPIM